jgi:hypothetical protein
VVGISGHSYSDIQCCFQFRLLKLKGPVVLFVARCRSRISFAQSLLSVVPRESLAPRQARGGYYMYWTTAVAEVETHPIQPFSFLGTSEAEYFGISLGRCGTSLSKTDKRYSAPKHWRAASLLDMAIQIQESKIVDLRRWFFVCPQPRLNDSSRLTRPILVSKKNRAAIKQCRNDE